ncbi:hypothetical protein [Collimonas pratensis]|uniref:hypothetical protein n=1 Tax=Collimonas pratensis TaxID=279113 RepID=UPI00197E9CA6|nr:hypothetical protein [Collimonas pratensis]
MSATQKREARLSTSCYAEAAQFCAENKGQIAIKLRIRAIENKRCAAPKRHHHC